MNPHYPQLFHPPPNHHHHHQEVVSVRWWIRQGRPSVMAEIRSRLQGNDLVKCFTVAWGAWYLRNEGVIRGKYPHADIVIPGFQRMVSQHSKLIQRPLAGRRNTFHSTSLISWTTPPLGFVKIKVDAAIFNDGTTGLGCICRDHNGTTIAMAARRMKARWSARTAEFAAARMGISIAQRLGLKDIVVEGDSLEVISTLQHNRVLLNHIFHLVNDIRKFISFFDSVSFSHMKRRGNCVAHCTARLGPPCGDELLYVNSFL